CESSFSSDPLRILRAFRFSAQLGFTIEPQTLRWISRHRPFGGGPISSSPPPAAERVREEFLRLLAQPRASSTLRQMDRLGILTDVFPEMEPCRRTAVRYYGKGGVFKHALHTVENLEWMFERMELSSNEKPATAPFRHFLELRTYIGQPVGGYPRRAWLKLAGFLHDIGK